jgi:hypothetical protein
MPSSKEEELLDHFEKVEAEIERLQGLTLFWYHNDDKEGAIIAALNHGDPVDALTAEARKIEAREK